MSSFSASEDQVIDLVATAQDLSEKWDVIPDALQDALQNAFVEILTKGRCDKDGMPLRKVSIYKLAWWKHKSQAQKEYRRLELLMLMNHSPLISSDDNPPLRLERAELLQMFVDAMDQLPERYRSILDAYSRVEPPIYERIAILLGIPIGTAKTRMQRAKAALTNKLVASRIYDDLREVI